MDHRLDKTFSLDPVLFLGFNKRNPEKNIIQRNVMLPIIIHRDFEYPRNHAFLELEGRMKRTTIVIEHSSKYNKRKADNIRLSFLGVSRIIKTS
jgi:hypothetical protein